MKKVLFIYNKGNTSGGVWNVNQLIASELLKNNFEVSYLAIREYDKEIAPKHDERIKFYVTNPKTKWLVSRGSKTIEKMKKGKFLDAIKAFYSYRKDKKIFKKDINRTKDLIKQINPDYILTSHYEQLDFIPNELLKRTVHVHHTTFNMVYEIKNCKKTYKKYNDKVAKYIWLSNATCEEAKKFGFKNSMCIYNAVRFETNEIANVDENKKIVSICRFSPEKRIKLMLEIADEVLKKHKDWIFELYGGDKLSNEEKIIADRNPNIKICGVTNDPKTVLLSSSININTSSFEGFSLSILEANECGIPTITFNTGESVVEEVINQKTGIIVYSGEKEDYINKLSDLMTNRIKLSKFSENAKEYNKNFRIESIIKTWLELFRKIDIDMDV